MKRWISLLLVFAMAFSLCGGINLTAYADEGTIEIADSSTVVSPETLDDAYGYAEYEESDDAIPEGSAADADAAGSIISTEEYEAESAGTIAQSPIEVANGVTIALDGEEAPTAKAVDGTTYLAFTSDIHNGTASGGETNVSNIRLTTWLSNVQPKYDNRINVFGFCGDMAAASSNTSTFWTFTKTVMDNIDSHGLTGVYAVGNHEYMNGSFGSTSNSPEVQGKYALNAEGLAPAGEKYVMYCLGTNSSHGSSWAYDDSQITALTNYINGVSRDKVIIILTHFPLHDYGMHRTGNTAPLVKALNSAAAGADATYGTDDDRKIVYLWGHNHSEGDDHYDEVWMPGDTLPDNNSTTSCFFYAAAGSMADAEYGSSAKVKGKGLVLEIDAENMLAFTYYDANGNNVTEPSSQTVYESGETPVIPVDPVDPDPDDPPSGDSVSITPSTSNPETSIKIAVGDTLTINVTNGSSNSAYDFSATLSNSSVGQIQGSSTVNIAAGSTGKFTVTGLAAGTFDVTIQNSNTYGSQYQRKGVVHVTVEQAGDPVSVTGVSVSPATATVEAKKTVQLTATVAPADATNKRVTWSSSNTSVATVDSTGKVKGVAEGTATITVTTADGGKTATSTVTVTASTSTEETVDITPTTDHPEQSITISVGDTLIINVTNGSTYSDYDFTATLSKSGVAQIEGSSSVNIAQGATGQFTFTGLADGTVDITISNNSTYGDQYTRKGIIHLTVGAGGDTPVDPPSGDTVDITPSTDNPEESIKIYVGDTFTANVTNGSSNSAYDFTASLSNSNVAQIQGSATVNIATGAVGQFTFKGIAAGTVDITIQNENQYGSQYVRKGIIHLTVEEAGDPVAVTGISLNKTSLAVTTGKTDTLTATITPSNATNKSVTWTSSNTAVATVDSNGKVTGVAQGTATITAASAENANIKATCTVTVSDPQPGAGTTYVLTDTLEAGKNYLIANGNTGSVYILSNEAGSSRQLKGIAATVNDDTITIDDATAAKAVFTAEANSSSAQNGLWLKNNGQYLYTNSADGLRMVQSSEQGSSDNAAKSWHYRGDSKNLLWYFKDSSSTDGYSDTSQTYKYYLEVSNGVFTDNHASTTSLANTNTPKMYLFVEDETHTHAWGSPAWTWTGSDATGYTAAAAVFTCTKCGETQTVTATVTSITSGGTTVYTATATFNGETYTDTKTVTVGVTYTFTGFAWTGSDAEGYTAAAANYSGSDGSTGTVNADLSTSEKAATCETDGEMKYTASVTAAHSLDGLQHSATKSNGIPALGHDWSDWIQTKAPTCTEKGEETRTCSRCRATETREIPALGHKEVELPAVAATCTETGLTAGVKCTVCGEILTAQQVVPALGHDMKAHTAVAATCEEAGNSAYWNCERCGKFFSDAAGRSEITANSWVIPATGHAWSVPAWTWTEDYTSATATFTCGNDAGHVSTVAAKVKETQGTGDDAGYTVYTATASDPDGKSWSDVKKSINLFTITYKLAGGELPEGKENPTEYTSLTPAFTLVNPVREGYTFMGWTGTGLDEATEIVTIEAGSTGNRTYTATWVANTYMIVYMANGGTGSMQNTFATYGRDVKLEANGFTRAGYDFTGWNTAADGSGESYADGATVKNLTASDSVDLYAQWEPQNSTPYTVEHYFEKIESGRYEVVRDAGKGVTDATVTATPLGNTGFTFDAENENNVTSGTVIADGSLVLKLYYTRNSYTVTFKDADGTVLKSEEVKFETMPACTEPSKPATETTVYTFAGWDPALAEVSGDATYTATYNSEAQTWTIDKSTWVWTGNDDDGYNAAKVTFVAAVGGFTKTVETKNVKAAQGTGGDAGYTVYTATVKGPDGNAYTAAKKAANSYTITFNSDGGSAVAAMTVKFGEEVKAPADPTKEGFTFAGWDPALPATMPANDLTVKALWSAETYIVEPAKLELLPKETGTVVVKDGAGAEVSVKWDSSDKTVATVDNEGNVTALKAGYTTLTTTVNGQELVCEVQGLFNDVTDPELFYYDYVYELANRGIVKGWEEDDTFRPMNNCNRAAMVTFLWRMAGEPEPETMATFSDMTGNVTFDKAISWAVENGIAGGYADGTFRPWKACNRMAFVTFLWRYAGKPAPKAMADFPDMTGNEEFDTAISWAAETGITTGYTDGTFRPYNDCLRLAVVSFLCRYEDLD